MNAASASARNPAHKPWHRHPWPWLLMLAPLTAVLWGAATLYIAIKYRDPLVTEHAWQDGQKLERGTQQRPAGD
ncbi:MAG: FixH family protein [Pseudomonadota bacterium]|nr:FixH family protein [Pseudomonadota bacterium]